MSSTPPMTGGNSSPESNRSRLLCRGPKWWADSGYDNAAEIEAVVAGGRTLVYCRPQGQKANLWRESLSAARARKGSSQQREKMRARLAQPEGARLYKRRQVWSEAPFHVIKNILGFRRFSLRGLAKVNLEWQLVALATIAAKSGCTGPDLKGRSAPQITFDQSTLSHQRFSVLLRGRSRQNFAPLQQAFAYRILSAQHRPKPDRLQRPSP